MPTTSFAKNLGKKWGRRLVSVELVFSALDDLAINHGCSSEALEKASTDETVINAIGDPIVRGPWYNAALAVTHRRHSVSRTIPVYGPQGTGVFPLRAVHDKGFIHHSELSSLLSSVLSLSITVYTYW
ncbi:hypothetical protein DCAR_0521195 [Daucus carota subsp. sativus]|uniref:Uncharacterized protein n=1 Tax=Daucus carota subsp. sativus TaxID=79200 RepID=A0AAF0X5Y3_DAUCS|nr:hypothetical protein DCAR_0521195 [Daucus carota subsp. sativus]